MKYSFPRKEKKEKELAEYVEALGRGHWDRRKFRESWTGWNERPYLKKQGGVLLRGIRDAGLWPPQGQIQD